MTQHLLAELEVTLARPKFRRLTDADVRAFLELLGSGLAEQVDDPDGPPSIGSKDPNDDYLIAAAASAGATPVTGDTHLLELANLIPVGSPRDFLDRLGYQSS